MNTFIASKNYPGRPPNLIPSDLNREDDNIVFTLDVFELFINRVNDVVSSKTVKYRNGTTVTLNEFEGIDILANLIESASLSPDESFYGTIHNMGHGIISYVHDPQNLYLVISKLLFNFAQIIF